MVVKGKDLFNVYVALLVYLKQREPRLPQGQIRRQYSLCFLHREASPFQSGRFRMRTWLSQQRDPDDRRWCRLPDKHTSAECNG